MGDSRAQIRVYQEKIERLKDRWSFLGQLRSSCIDLCAVALLGFEAERDAGIELCLLMWFWICVSCKLPTYCCYVCGGGVIVVNASFQNVKLPSQSSNKGIWGTTGLEGDLLVLNSPCIACKGSQKVIATCHFAGPPL